MGDIIFIQSGKSDFPGSKGLDFFVQIIFDLYSLHF
jgi:triacylglycerol esterase/lipase EstA (alpha/beta hydrolase family)